MAPTNPRPNAATRPSIPADLPTPAELDQQAARLRAQAVALNRRNAERIETSQSDLESRIDAAERTVQTARAAAEAASKQADELQDKAQEMSRAARSMEADAAKRFDVDGRPGDDNSEQAQNLRASAVAMTRRAERAQQEARRQLDVAEDAERQVFQLRREATDLSDADDGLRLTSYQLDDKARALEEAAGHLRQANDSFPGSEGPHVAKAQEALAEAERVVFDFGRITVDDAIAAGIPVSSLPGADLMTPTAAPVGPFVNDTDLLHPGGDTFADPVNPAAGEPLDAGDPVDPLGAPEGPEPMDPAGADAGPAAGQPADAPDLVEPLFPEGAGADASGVPGVAGPGAAVAYTEPGPAEAGHDEPAADVYADAYTDAGSEAWA